MNILVQSFCEGSGGVGEGMIDFFLSLFAGTVRSASLHVRFLLEIIEALDIEVTFVATQG